MDGITRGLALWELGPGMAVDNLSGHEIRRGQGSRSGADRSKADMKWLAREKRLFGADAGPEMRSMEAG